MHTTNRLFGFGFRLAVAFLITAAPLKLASAQSTVATDPVGFTTTTLLGSSDTFVSIPFTRPPEFIGAIVSAAGSTITLVGNPLLVSQFLYGGSQHNHYYALIGPISGTGTKEGHTFQITDNTANTLTVVTGSDNLNGIPANTQVEVIPYWTPATIFPATDANVSFTPTSSPPTYQTLLRVPNYSASGTNLPYAGEYYFNNNAWQRLSPAGDGSDDPLLPDAYFVVRNTNGAPTLPLTNIGSVLLKKLAVPLTSLPSSQNQAQDNPVSMVRPVNVALDATGLNPGDSSFVAGDQLVLFNNAVAGIDKSPSAIYTYDTHWRLNGDTSGSDRGADIITSGTGFIVRKAGTASGGQTFWTNAFPVSAVSAVSRKVQGTDRDIPLPLGTGFGVECRSGGLTQVVFAFPAAVTINTGAGTGGASITSGNGSVVPPPNGVIVSGTTVTVNLSGVTDVQWVTVTLLGVSDGVNTNDVAVKAGVLLGDVNGNGVLTNADVSLVKAQVAAGGTVGPSNFRDDVNANNVITNADVSVTKARVAAGAQLPPLP
jgi:uncharacterized protein (TIGR02597 family)